MRPVLSVPGERSPMTAMALHDHAPLIATGSHNQLISVLTAPQWHTASARSGGNAGAVGARGSASAATVAEDEADPVIARIRYHDSFISQRIGPVSCVAFHPWDLHLAAGFTDSGLVSVYTLR